MNEYLERPEPHFSYFDTNITFRTLLGGTAYKLNVTSLQWLNDTSYKVKGGSSIWTHEVLILKPNTLRFNDTALMLFTVTTSSCNNNKPFSTIFDHPDIEAADAFAHATQ